MKKKKKNFISISRIRKRSCTVEQILTIAACERVVVIKRLPKYLLHNINRRCDLGFVASTNTIE